MVEGNSGKLAVAASIALHGAVLVFASQTRWSAPATLPAADTVVVWLSDWQLPEARSIEDDPGEPTDVDVEPGPIAEDEPESEPLAPTRATDSPEPSLLPPPRDLEPSRRPIDWEAAMRRAVVHMREERAKADAYLTFSYPERRPEPSRETGIDATTIAGIQTRTHGPCVRSVRSFLARLLMPVDVCEWGTTASDSYLSADQHDRLAALRSELEAYASQ